MMTKTLRVKEENRFFKEICGHADMVRCPEVGQFSLNKEGRKKMVSKGGLLSLIKSTFEGKEVEFKDFVIQAEKKKYSFEDVAVEVSTKNLKIYFSCPKMYMDLVRSFPCKIHVGYPERSAFRAVVSLGCLEKNNIFVSELRFK